VVSPIASEISIEKSKREVIRTNKKTVNFFIYNYTSNFELCYYTLNDSTAKRVFSRIFLEKSYPVASPGAHAGAPLQKLLKRFATDVGENLCVLPVKINVLIFFGYDSKNHVFSVQSLNKFVLDFKSKRWDKMKKVVVLLALLLITLSVLGISLPKEHVAYDPYGNRIYQVDTGEIKTGFTIIGEGEPLLLLMGLGGTIMDWPKTIIDMLS